MAPITDSPTYPSSMLPVPFPTELAGPAAEQCRAVARLITEKMNAASDAAGTATPTWTGGHADDFDLVWPDTETSATELVQRLYRLAGEIDAAVSGAAAENRRRATLREEWDREHAPQEGPR